MSFAETIQLSGSILSAECVDCSDECGLQVTQRTGFDLNDYLGNKEGSFTTEFAGFANSANDVQLNLDDGVILTASLWKGDGSWAKASFDLEKHIANEDGFLTFIQD